MLILRGIYVARVLVFFHMARCFCSSVSVFRLPFGFMIRYSFFFFSSRRRHTRSLCDWSSDVCSSDLFDLTPEFPISPPNSVVYCVDEKSGIQALDRTPPGLPWKKGKCGTHTHDYKRHGTDRKSVV